MRKKKYLSVLEEWIIKLSKKDLFNLRKLTILPGIIFKRHKLRNIRYADDTVVMEDKEKTASTFRQVNKGK